MEKPFKAKMTEKDFKAVLRQRWEETLNSPLNEKQEKLLDDWVNYFYYPTFDVWKAVELLKLAWKCEVELFGLVQR